MANYNDTYCYVFEKSEKMKELIHTLLIHEKEENSIAKEWCYLDSEKISPKPESFDKMTKEEKHDWIFENWGIMQDFYYKIFEDYTVFFIEGRWSSSHVLFEKFSEKYNLPVYIEFLPEGGYDNLFIYNNPLTKMRFSIEMSDCLYSGIPTPSYFINFQMMGVKENIFVITTKENRALPIEENGYVFWKQRKIKELEEKELERNKKKITTSTEDDLFGEEDVF